MVRNFIPMKNLQLHKKQLANILLIVNQSTIRNSYNMSSMVWFANPPWDLYLNLIDEDDPCNYKITNYHLLKISDRQKLVLKSIAMARLSPFDS